MKAAEDFEAEYQRIERELEQLGRLAVVAMIVLLVVGAVGWVVL